MIPADPAMIEFIEALKARELEQFRQLLQVMAVKIPELQPILDQLKNAYLVGLHCGVAIGMETAEEMIRQTVRKAVK